MSTYHPFILILKNEKENKWHPIVFLPDPLPGPPSSDKPDRFKSKMHHTGGFESREEAVSNIEKDLVPRVKAAFIGEPVVDTSKDIPWDGEGLPAMVGFESPDGKSLVFL